MNARLLVAFLSVAASTGCIIVSNPPPVLHPGDVTFTWSFAGQSCNQMPSIKSVKVSIAGQSLENGGVYPCLVVDYPGIVLKDFAGGTYDATVEAFGYAGEKLYTTTTRFTVNGSVRVDVDLTPVGGPTSFGYLTWQFPALVGAPNPDCTTAGVSNVLISIDGAAAITVACNLGFNTNPGVQSPYVTPGTHNIDLFAVDSTGYVYYSAASTLKTVANQPMSFLYNLKWAVGGTAVAWSITDGSVAQTCGQAGVTDVYVNFVDSTGTLVYAAPGDKHPCSAAGVEFSFLKPGNYSVRVSATGTGSRFYQSNFNSAPQVTVVAGQFPTMSSAVNVQMFRQ